MGCGEERLWELGTLALEMGMKAKGMRIEETKEGVSNRLFSVREEWDQDQCFES